MKKICYLIIICFFSITDSVSQNLSKRDSIKLKKINIDLNNLSMKDQFQLENILYFDRRIKVNKAFNIIFQVFAAPYISLGVISLATVGRTDPTWRGLNVVAGVIGFLVGGSIYGISRPFKKGIMRNKILRDRLIHKLSIGGY